MFKNFFVPTDEFGKIIKNALPGKEIKSLSLISTGWTNIVYEAKTQNEGESYFFRFPRDDFWERTIVKDCQFAGFIYGKTNYKTANLKLLENENRSFSVHRKIDGSSLTDELETLNKDELDKISFEIADFMCQLHNVKYKENEVFSCNNIGLNLVDFLNELITLHLDNASSKFWNYNYLKNTEENNCLVHGDFNPGNIILDENNNLAAVIDFGFAGFGNKYFDIARILSRNPPKEFKEGIINHYEEISHEKLDKIKLEEEIDLWQEIDSGYIKYMKNVGIC